jgi:hypothetical protein
VGRCSPAGLAVIQQHMEAEYEGWAIEAVMALACESWRVGCRSIEELPDRGDAECWMNEFLSSDGVPPLRMRVVFEGSKR